jgi:hypothetical protein
MEAGEEVTEQTIEREIDHALGHARALGGKGSPKKTRENSLVITKLEEARMWNTYDIQKKERP